MSPSQVSDRVADAGFGLSGSGALFGLSIGQINEYLQAGAFIVAMISGACAAYYYIRKARQK